MSTTPDPVCRYLDVLEAINLSIVIAGLGKTTKHTSISDVVTLTRKAFQLPIQMAENFYIILKDLMQVAYW